MSLLVVEGLQKAFGGLLAVNNINFRIEPGEVVALIGPNGAGKTTIVNLITGTFHPDRGTILFAGHNVTALPPWELAKRGMARTFQAVKIFPGLSVLENVQLGAFLRTASPVEAMKRAEEILEFVGMIEERKVLAKALTLEKRKRLELARALATNPRLLFLDEVMAGLNPKELAEEIEIIRRINATGVTILLIEHILRAVLALSQRVIVLNQGEILAEGPAEAVMKNRAVIEAYLGEGYRDAGSS